MVLTMMGVLALAYGIQLMAGAVAGLFEMP
jgi:hypothetical protein